MLCILIQYRIIDMQGQNAIRRQGRKEPDFAIRHKVKHRMTFSPPAVDPTEPPTTISIKRMNWEKERPFSVVP